MATLLLQKQNKKYNNKLDFQNKKSKILYILHQEAELVLFVDFDGDSF